MNARYMLLSAGIAGAFAALASNVPVLEMVNCLLCGWLWLGGILAVWIYHWNVEEPVTRGNAMILGVVTGLVATAVDTLLTALMGMNAAPVPPETMAQLREAFGPQADLLFSQGASLLVTFIFSLIFYTLFAMLGGLLGAMIFKGKAVEAEPAG